MALSTLCLVACPLIAQTGEPELAPPPAAEASLWEGADRSPWPFRWDERWRPSFNVYGNVLARKERKNVFDEDGDEVSDVARLRQLDFTLESMVSEDVALFVAPMVRSSLANDEFDIDVDQAWLRFARVPLLGALPSGVDVRAGQFRAGFGRLNRERVYDLPQPTRPRALTNLFGEDGYAETGLSTSTALRFSEAGILRITAEYLDSGSPPITDRDGGFAGGNNLRLAWVSDADEVHGVECGASYLRSRRADRDSRRVTILGLDALYRWRPRADEPERFWLGGEWIQGDIGQTAAPNSEPTGAYLWTRYRLDDRWSVGARFDLADEFSADDQRTTTTALYIGYQQAEHLRFAVSVERSQSDVALLDDVTRAFVELNFAVGSSPLRPFWAR